MLTRSYKKASYKCVDCDFIAGNEATMLIGNQHTDTVDCGICHISAKTKENLELHQTTCEIYQCYDCEHREKTISGI